MDDVSEILRSLRATRRFEPRPVSEAVVAEIVDVARWTGSARNRQPWRIGLVRNADKRRALARLGAYAAVLADAPLVTVLAVDRDLGGADAEFDAGRFAQTLMLAAHSSGVGSCPVSFFPPENEHAASSIIGLAEPWLARTAIALGYPAPARHAQRGRSAIPTGRHLAETLIVSRDL